MSQQSPINLEPTVDSPTPLNLITAWQPTATGVYSVLPEGQTIKFQSNPAVVPDSYIMYNDEKYMLYSYHFHKPSEHELYTNHSLVEMHIVHQTTDGQKYVVFSLMLDIIGDGTEGLLFSSLELIIAVMNNSGSQQFPTPATLFINPINFITYQGSLTTPPYSGNVTWLIYPNYVRTSQSFLDNIFPPGSTSHVRPIQPLLPGTVVENINWTPASVQS